MRRKVRGVKRKTKPAPRRLRLLSVFLGAAILAVGFAILVVRLQATREGYRLSALHAEVESYQERNRTLKLEIAELSSRSRLRALAPSYHLGPPAPGQVITLP
jgi:cell division protein FtsL